MNGTIKIAFLYLLLLGSQAIYMYVSNKAQLKKYRILYLLAIPYVAAFPAIFSYQDPQNYNLFEYAIIVCMITAAIADAAYSAALNKEYLSDGTVRRFSYSFLIICAASSCISTVNMWMKLVSLLILAGTFCVLCFVKKHPYKEFLKSLPLAVISLACSYILINSVN